MVVADGAGGLAGGARAAEFLAGETTGVVLAVAEDRVAGAICRDSAWVVHPDGGSMT